MEIDKLKAAYAGLESKMKVGGKNEKGKNWIGDDQGSELSSITEKSFVNQN